MASHDPQAARINIKNPAQVAAVNGSLTFTTDRGYVGDGSTGYLETSVADNAGGNLSQNTASIFAYVNVEPTAGSSVIGLSALSSTRLIVNPAVAPSGRLHNATNVTGTTASSLGLSVEVRTDSVTTQMYRFGAFEATATTAAASATTADTFQFFRSNGSFLAVARVALAGWGGALTATQNTAFNFCAVQYLTAIGGN